LICAHTHKKEKQSWADLLAVRKNTPTKVHGLKKKMNVLLIISKLKVKVVGDLSLRLLVSFSFSFLFFQLLMP
jgi:hypothetical protein